MMVNTVQIPTYVIKMRIVWHLLHYEGPRINHIALHYVHICRYLFRNMTHMDILGRSGKLCSIIIIILQK
jgi:hypothetical protein